MNKLYHYIAIGLFALCAISCAKEDDLTPTGLNEDYFSVSPDATDEISVLRQEFYEKHGIHLLFNDTLRHEQRGTYEDGSPIWFTETVDLNYNISSNGTADYSLEYLNNQEAREAAIDLVERHVLSHLGEGLQPYSFLLLQQISSYNSYYEEYENVDFVNNIRCMAISTGDIATASDEEQEAFCLGILHSIISNNIESLEESAFEEFYSFCSEYYGADYADFGMSDYPENEELYELGFILTYMWYFPYEYNDLESFVDAVFEMSETEFTEMYGDYPIIMQKYEIIKQIISDMGYVF